jgi:hypothetical protein
MHHGIMGPDLPSEDQPFTLDAFLHRWPTGAEKVELLFGALYFSGRFDERDVALAGRTFPGRHVALMAGGDLVVGSAGGEEVAQLRALVDGG